jgi:transglutaminase-like putative cysteine protease
MFKRWKAFLKRHLAPAEESGLYRAAVTVLVMFALVLTLHQIEWPSYWWAVLLLTPSASYLSYLRRHSPNLEIKIFLSFAMVALLYWFLVRLSASLFDPRIPLAELLIWLQTLHAFDLPAKKDLRYTVLVALILMAMASVLTYSSFFALWVLLFCAMFVAVAAIDFWSDNRQPGTREARGELLREGASYRIDRAWLARTLLLALPAALLMASVIFVFMPRFQGLTLRTMPLNWNLQFSLARISDGAIVNQALPQTSGDQSGKPQRVSGDSYFGFDSEVNLNTRGELSDRLVMKVRTSDWQYHRAVTFAEYTGGGWKSGLTEPRLKTIEEPPFYFQTVGHRTKDRLTIYYAEVDLPNVVFTPQYVRTLYFPSSEIFLVDSFAGKGKDLNNAPAVIVAPFAIETGMVYSILNRMPGVSPTDLKNLDAFPPNDARWKILAPYLQLPPTMPSRVSDKARELVAGKTKPWEKASVLCSYLQQNYTYNLDVPFYPEGVDTVDHFLFEAREGYCEQFATSLCVMARSVGLPARYVTGYLPGDFNPLSGFYEIHANDAHAWVEIFIPGNGWTLFDPVPGGNPNPSLGESEPDRWLLESLFKYIGVPEWVRKLAPNVIRLSVGLALVFLVLALWRGGGPTGGLSKASSALLPYLKRAEGLTEPRRPGETVKNWSRRLAREPLARLADVYERTFYQDRPLSQADRAQLEAAVSELKAAKKNGSKAGIRDRGP